MHAPQNNKKRLMLLVLPFILAAVLVSALMLIEQARPYKELTIGETTLFVPKAYLQETNGDLIEMLRDYVATVELEAYQFNAYSDEILPAHLTHDDNVASASLIWTVGPAKAKPEASGLLPADAALFSGSGSFNQRTVSFDKTRQLYKINRSNDFGRNYAYSNMNPALPATSSTWLAHCIELGSVRPGGPWGRCTQQMVHGDIQIQIHYDGRLVSHSATIADALGTMIDGWRTEPTE